MANEWIYLVEEYLEDAGFEPILYYIRPVRDSVEVDFDDQGAVFFIIDDIRKTPYHKEFIVDYKKTVNSKRHTAIFYRRD
jgi:hypothetical protein